VNTGGKRSPGDAGPNKIYFVRAAQIHVRRQPMKLLAPIFQRVANPVNTFGFTFVYDGLLLPAIHGLHDFLGQLANLPDQLHESHPDEFQRVHAADRLRLGFGPGQSDALGFHEQQHDAADEHERTCDGRNEMIVRGGNVHPQEINFLSRSREAQARIGEHHNSQDDQNGCDDGFHVQAV
jgi:hypothetical protein